MPSVLVGLVLVLAVAAPITQAACDSNTSPRPDEFDDLPDTATSSRAPMAFVFGRKWSRPTWKSRGLSRSHLTVGFL